MSIKKTLVFVLSVFFDFLICFTLILIIAIGKDKNYL